MSSFLSTLRSKRATPTIDRRAPWRRSLAWFGRIWHPLQRKELALPSWIHLLVEFLKQRSHAQRASRFTALLMFGLLALVMLLVVTGVVGLLVVSWRKFHV